MSITYYVPTLGRVGDQRLLSGLKEAGCSLLSQITLVCVPSEYKAHKAEWYGSQVKKVQALPPEVDCIAKKRKWMTLNCPTTHFCMFDDDVAFLLWSAKYNNHLKHSEHSSRSGLLLQYLESLPALMADRAFASFGGRFMAKMIIRDKGFVVDNTGYCAVMFNTKQARRLEFNRMMFYNDADALLQLMTNTGKPGVQDLHVLIEKKNTKKVDTTGADVYRTKFMVDDSLIKLVQYQAGRVYGKKDDNSHSIQNRVSISYRNARVWNTLPVDKREALKAKSKLGLEAMLKEHSLQSAPALFPFEDEMPRAEIVNQLTRRWEAAKSKKVTTKKGLFS